MIKTAQDMKSYKKQIRKALADSFLRSALDEFNTVYRENRPTVYKDIDFNTFRDAIAENKDSLIPFFEILFEEFKSNAQKAGYKYVPSKDEDVCCGFGGSYSVDFPEISSEILKKKLDNVEASGADILVTDCPGCVMQLSGGLDKRQSHIKVLHLVELLAQKNSAIPAVLHSH